MLRTRFHVALLGLGALFACKAAEKPAPSRPVLVGEFEGVAGLGAENADGFVRLRPTMAAVQANPNLLPVEALSLGGWSFDNVTKKVEGPASPAGTLGETWHVSFLHGDPADPDHPGDTNNGQRHTMVFSLRLPVGTYTFSWYAKKGPADLFWGDYTQEPWHTGTVAYIVQNGEYGHGERISDWAEYFDSEAGYTSWTGWQRFSVKFVVPRTHVIPEVGDPFDTDTPTVWIRPLHSGDSYSTDLYFWGFKVEAGSTATGVVTGQVATGGGPDHNPPGTLELYSIGNFSEDVNVNGCGLAISAPMTLKSYYTEELIDAQVQVDSLGAIDHYLCGAQATAPVGSPAVSTKGGLVSYGDLAGSPVSDGSAPGGSSQQTWAFNTTAGSSFSIRARVYAHIFPPPPALGSFTGGNLQFTIDPFADGARVEVCTDATCSNLQGGGAASCSLQPVSVDPDLNGRSCTFAPGGLASGQTYYWRAYNTWGGTKGTAPSDIGSFTVP